LIVHIDDKDLIKLYETGSSKKLRLTENVIEKFFATVQKIESAINIYDFWKDSGLKFEKLKGYKNRYSMRLSGKHRLEMEITWTNNDQTIGEFYLITISGHYGD
jgi:toxin HigB-1